ncbi:MAG: capsular biosynthesis protein [Cyclobacteriaceae bacterium]|nr:capsular biosynthesis protein [Cyclobacteriaceae bacterium]
MLNIFRRTPILKTGFPDIHSHLLAGLDDGSKSLEQSEEMIRLMLDLGYTGFVTTPHIMSDYYRNNRDTIFPALERLQEHLKTVGLTVRVQAAAEYYLDEALMKMIEKPDQLLFLGDRYFLFETNMFSQPLTMNEFIFKLSVESIRPVLAHPERYEYLHQDFAKVEELRDRGVLFQINSLSLLGAYGKAAEKLARTLIEKEWVSFLGSDCHTPLHAKGLADVARDRHFKKALDLPLLNRTLV